MNPGDADDNANLMTRLRARAAELRRLPESTYRLQFHKGFTFRDATAIIPYLHDLGVTHVYASPYLKANPGSTHGYDVIDHCALNPELGSEADYEAFVAELARHGMSHILDTVPNHVGVATNENTWWNDVLARGRASAYATFFDISWRGSPRESLRDKVLLPVLGRPYGEALEKGELRLVAEEGGIYVRYYDRRFPISPESAQDIRDVEQFNGRPGEPRSFDRLDALLSRQHYRLAYWRVASEEINYRRFFDINDLAALAMERAEVFEATHALTLRLLAEGKVSGLRIDHPDGLLDPEEYFARLQTGYLSALARTFGDSEDQISSISAALGELAAAERPLYVVVEKILAADEPLPPDWPVNGTSGYDFLNKVNGLFVDSSSEGELTALYREITGQSADFPEIAYRKKLLILDTALASELQMLTQRLDDIAQSHRASRDFTRKGLWSALRETIACFDVYRTYITARGVSASDVEHIDAAIGRAESRNPAIDPSVFHFLRDVLLQRLSPDASAAIRHSALELVGKFQQLTAPVTAKGIEDTAFYVFNRFISLNEVGGDPGRFGTSVDELHRYFADRQRRWPYALSCLSTHDTKRSEDVRARLNVLSEIPAQWADHVKCWFAVNAPHRQTMNGHTAPEANEEYLLYQTLVGAWLLGADGADQNFIDRIVQYMQKAMREAKVWTSWTDPNTAHEAAVENFIRSILKSQAFLADFAPFVRRLSAVGLWNSLSQTVLRLTAPGVPDTYQGSELWDFSLVDPDNRRTVDYPQRRVALENLGDLASLLKSRQDGRLKLFVLRQGLRARREHPGLFSCGHYLPATTSGQRPEHVFAYARRTSNALALMAVPRFTTRLVARSDDPPIGSSVWQDTRIHFPLPDGNRRFRDTFTGQTLTAADDGTFSAADLFRSFPAALLISD